MAPKLDTWLRGFDSASAQWRDRGIDAPPGIQPGEESEPPLNLEARYRRFPKLRPDPLEDQSPDEPELR